jgi:hypothetical protein
MTRVQTIDEAVLLQKSYSPNEGVAKELAGKTFVMFVGPAAIGKTFVMSALAKADSRFGLVPVFTTREPRADDDPDMFRTQPHDEAHIATILEKISKRQIVQYAVHPTSQRFYGSETQDYAHEYNMLPTLSGVVDSMSKLPFKRVLIVGLVTDPATWEQWLKERYPEESQERRQRILEATKSLNWLLSSSKDIIWIHNSANNLSVTTHAILDAILYNKRDDNAKSLAYELRDKAKELL